MLSAGDAGRSVIGSRNGAARRRAAASRPRPVGDAPGEVVVDVAQVGDHPLADVDALALAQLEDEGVDDVVLLDRCLADEELAGLAVVVGERLRADPALRPGLLVGERQEPAVGILARPGRRRRSTSSARS